MKKTNLFYCIVSSVGFSWTNGIRDLAGLVIGVTLIWLIVSVIVSLASKKPIWSRSLKVALLIMLVSALFLILFSYFTSNLAVKASC